MASDQEDWLKTSAGQAWLKDWLKNDAEGQAWLKDWLEGSKEQAWLKNWLKPTA